jgi:hypothetical protein
MADVLICGLFVLESSWDRAARGETKVVRRTDREGNMKKR